MHILNGSTASLKSAIRDEITFPGNIAKAPGKSMKARRVQEWLCLHDRMVVVDGEFGGATEAAVRAFQRDNGLQETGLVDEATFESLVAPMKRVLRPQVDTSLSLGDAIVAVAGAHLKEHPLEVGSVANSGPWVRLYMDGNSGPDWLWCAGFVTFIMKQAAELTGRPAPVKGSFSCDLLATQAKEKGVFLKEGSATPARSRQAPSSWCAGFRTTDSYRDRQQPEQTAFKTIEGNTNDGGSSNGIEACAARAATEEGLRRHGVSRAAALGARAASGEAVRTTRPQRS